MTQSQPKLFIAGLLISVALHSVFLYIFLSHTNFCSLFHTHKSRTLSISLLSTSVAKKKALVTAKRVELKATHKNNGTIVKQPSSHLGFTPSIESQPTLQKPDKSMFISFVENIQIDRGILGQNLFPRKYHALFKLRMGPGEGILADFLDLTPVDLPLKYVDLQVKKSFLKKIKQVDLHSFAKYLFHLNKESFGLVIISLEFKE